MIKRYFLTTQASEDLEEIHNFIAEDSVKRALNFIDLIEDNIELIATNPGIGKYRNELFPEMHSLPVGDYIIFYRIKQKHVEVLRILHGSRDLPNYFE